MCVIMYKPKTVTISTKTLRQAWVSNPDGAGVVFRFNDSQCWQAVKGFLNLSDLTAFISTIKHAEMIVHFRYGTAGRLDKANCHPFLVSNRTRDLSRLSFSTTTAPILCHNGVIRDLGSEEYSDTAELCRFILPNLKTRAWDKTLTAIGGKYVYVIAKRSPVFIGDFQEYHGLLVSNLSWQFVYYEPKTSTKVTPLSPLRKKLTWSEDDSLLNNWALT